ncbi:hypothetical protein MNB_SUP05-SYMBIONT-5-205 [hydrothermal vent metagenome]|uniref:Uncharacterized protein n=1 Tax=hydrothermal vent metagenome TaxID=652676 RepID=A0A1W1E0G2_9ZZZZ
MISIFGLGYLNKVLKNLSCVKIISNLFFKKEEAKVIFKEYGMRLSDAINC